MIKSTQIPRQPYFFIGRKDTMSLILNSLEQYNTFIIEGVSGIGKTTLLQKLIYTDEIKSKY